MEDYRGLLRAWQMDNMEYPPDPEGVMQINFPYDHLLIIRDLCLSTYDPDRLSDFDVSLLLIADKIEKELGIE